MDGAVACALMPAGSGSNHQEWIDVSIPIRGGMVHFPGDPGVELRRVRSLDRGDDATLSHLALGVHSGTHVDAPVHFIAATSGVDAIPIDAMIGPARIIDLGDVEACTATDLAAYEIASGERILLRTINSTQAWRGERFYERYAHLTTSAAQLLADRRVRMIGIDYLSIGRGDTGPAVHRTLLAAGVVIVEGLDLSRVEAGRYDVVCMPMRIEGCDGAPARVAVRRRDHVQRAHPTPRAAPSDTIQALVVSMEQRAVRVVRRPAPRAPTGTEVLLRTLEVGICGTDREIGSFVYGTPPPGANELVIGHEALAEVVDVGRDVSWCKRGELVVPTVRRPCTSPRCQACRNDRPDFCTTGEFTERGIARADGYLCEYFLDEEAFLIPVPRVIEEVAVLVEPLSVAAKAIDEFELIRERFGFDLPRPRGLVIGAGPVGLLGAMTFRARGLETYVFSREPEDDPRAALVRALGATYVSSQRTPVDQLASRIGRIDVVFEAVGVPSVAFGALPVLAANGIFVMSGVPAPRPAVLAELSEWMRALVLKNQVVVGTVNAGRLSYEHAVAMLEQFLTLFPDAVRSLLHRVPLEHAADVIARKRHIKDVVSLST
jgi:threonine dehydrogenase-like Zn-dependent dehydrogenase/kynurenine formamidase